MSLMDEPKVAPPSTISSGLVRSLGAAAARPWLRPRRHPIPGGSLAKPSIFKLVLLGSGSVVKSSLALRSVKSDFRASCLPSVFSPLKHFRSASLAEGQEHGSCGETCSVRTNSLAEPQLMSPSLEQWSRWREDPLLCMKALPDMWVAEILAQRKCCGVDHVRSERIPHL
ncbi:uncharacterized protein LOC143674103 [Tamandua tetradactyla]|uniref:uncharacterized protein LOC143674103 n=1 Tax=Tamandua tetradactyla TaxID=48850 RepID=UPI0040538134